MVCEDDDDFEQATGNDDDDVEEAMTDELTQALATATCDDDCATACENAGSE